MRKRIDENSLRNKMFEDTYLALKNLVEACRSNQILKPIKGNRSEDLVERCTVRMSTSRQSGHTHSLFECFKKTPTSSVLGMN